MRTFFALAIALSACATSSTGPNKPVNVAAVRHQIDDQIQAESHDRSITSMGHVDQTHATVFTTLKTGSRQEENWIKGDGGWKLDKKTAMN